MRKFIPANVRKSKPALTGSLEQMIEVAGLDLNEYSSIYDENGSYFQFRKEINLFDKEIIKDISQFYHDMLKANIEYKLYTELRSEHTDKSLWEAVNAEYKFINHLRKANTKIPNLLEYFSKYK